MSLLLHVYNGLTRSADDSTLAQDNGTDNRAKCKLIVACGGSINRKSARNNMIISIGPPIVQQSVKAAERDQQFMVENDLWRS